MPDGERTEAPVEPLTSPAPLTLDSPDANTTAQASVTTPLASPVASPATTVPPTQPTTQSQSYTEQLKQEFSTIFDSLTLSSPVHKAFLKSRWLDQILWMESKSSQCRDRHFRLRLITIIGGVIVPILVTLNLNDQRIENTVKQATIGISGAVAITAAIEEFFQYGKRWYNYRRAAESLKAQGWHFFQLSGPYRDFTDHNAAFKTFAENIEDIIQRDVETYVTQPQQQREQESSNRDNHHGNEDVA